MEFAWTPEQIQLREAVVAFGRTLIVGDDLIRRDREASFSRAAWQRCAEFGIQGLPFPADCGGGGQDILTTILALEALGSVCPDNGLLFALGAQMWSVQMPILRHGTEEQRRKYLVPLCRGEQIGAHGMSEPDSGSDAFALRTTARRDGDHYVLNGAKTFVSEAPVADLFVVFATIDRAKGPLGLTGFIVEKETPGFRVGRHIEKMGLRTSPMAELVFEDCRVPVANRLGREGRGVTIFNDSMEWERGCILATNLGTLDRLIQSSVRHVRERRQFGHSIGEFQAVANKIVAMKVRLEAARLLLYQAAWAKANESVAGAGTAIAKLFLSEAMVQSGLDAIQVRGGYGYAVEYQVERDLRDAIGGTLYSGTSEIQRNLIARSLGL